MYTSIRFSSLLERRSGSCRWAVTPFRVVNTNRKSIRHSEAKPKSANCAKGKIILKKNERTKSPTRHNSPMKKPVCKYILLIEVWQHFL